VNADVLDLWQRALRSLQTARELCDRDPDAAASRAYYAAFYAVSAFFALEGKAFSKHTAIVAAVHRDLVKAGRLPAEFGEAFSALSALRATGDYGGPRHVNATDAQAAVSQAESILAAIRGISPEVLS